MIIQLSVKSHKFYTNTDFDSEWMCGGSKSPQILDIDVFKQMISISFQMRLNAESKIEASHKNGS